MRDKELQQLTAYLDGELPSQERDTVLRLLKQSEEARRILRQFQQDRDGLQNLPRQKLPAEFADSILAQIHRERENIARPVLRLYWQSITVAAAVILAVGFATVYLLNDLLRPGPEPVVAKVGPEKQPEAIAAKPQSDAVKAWGDLQKQLPTEEQVVDYVVQWQDQLDSMRQGLESLFRSTSTGIAQALNRGDIPSAAQTRSVLTSPTGVDNPFKTIDLRLPVFWNIRSLQNDTTLRTLREGGIYHLDVACKESWTALAKLETACKRSGIALTVDAEASRRMEKKQPGMYLVCLQNIAPEQVARLLMTLQTQAKQGDTQFDSVMVQPLDAEGQKRMAAALGSLDTAPRPAGQGGESVAKPAAPTAIALLYNASRNRATLTKESKQLLSQPAAPQAGTIQVYLLLRPSRR